MGSGRGSTLFRNCDIQYLTVDTMTEDNFKVHIFLFGICIMCFMVTIIVKAITCMLFHHVKIISKLFNKIKQNLFATIDSWLILKPESEISVRERTM